MAKYYRVKQNTFIWAKGAILKYSDSHTNGGYEAISDLWDSVDLEDEYITAHIVEDKDNSDWFERVYDTGLVGKMKFATKEKAQEVYNKLFIDKGDE
jgi:hypothetical protein